MITPVRLAARAILSATASALLLSTLPLHAQELVPPPSEHAVLRDIVEDVSAGRLEADIRTLAGFGTRHTLSDTVSDTRGIGAARRWIKAQFDQISAECGGCLEVHYQANLVGGTRRIPDTVNVVNVIAI